MCLQCGVGTEEAVPLFGSICAEAGGKPYCGRNSGESAQTGDVQPAAVLTAAASRKLPLNAAGGMIPGPEVMRAENCTLQKIDFKQCG